MDKISIIIPCFNEEEVLPYFYKETLEELKKIENILYEFIFVDDGSYDHTKDILKSFTYLDKNSHYYSFSRNFGKEAAMYAGLQQAKGDFCVIMDADLQHPPALLKDMYATIKQGQYDCCAGKRIDRIGENKIRSCFSKAFYKVIQKLTKLDMTDGSGDFRMMNRTMVNAILEMKEYNRYMKGIFSFIGFDTKWIPFNNIERKAGKTKWSFKSLFVYAMEGITSFSTMPLKLAGIVGGIILVCAMLLISYLLVGAIINIKINSSFYLLTIILLLSGLQMVFVSILSQYISKDYLENKNRPIYIIKDSDRN